MSLGNPTLFAWLREYKATLSRMHDYGLVPTH